MDYSSYCEELFEALTKNKSEPVNSEVKTEQKKIDELTEDIIKLRFYNFETNSDFVGKFKGEGESFSVGDKYLKTWAFTDVNELPWLIPQWHTMNEPQGNFKGFSKEVPGEWSYIIVYVSKTETENGARHNIKVFRKRF